MKIYENRFSGPDVRVTCVCVCVCARARGRAHHRRRLLARGFRRRCSVFAFSWILLQVPLAHTVPRSRAEQWAKPTARLIMNLGEAEAEVMHLRDALRRSEAELEMEREMRKRIEEDNMIEKQLRYEVEGDLEMQMARASESEYRASESERWLNSMKPRYERMEGSVQALSIEAHTWRHIVRRLTNGAEDLAWDLCDGRELVRRVPDRRRLRIERWIREAHRDMMLDRQRSREGTPPR